MAEGIVRCAPDDPNRCQGIDNKSGQCDKLAVPGSDRCKIHGTPAHFVKKNNFNGYMLTKWEDRLGRLADNEGVRSLRVEIGILKMTLESLILRCQNDEDLLDHSNKMMQLIDKIKEVVVSCHRLEKSTGMMLDKSAALQIAGNICSIIGNHIDDPEVIEAIANEIITQILNIEGLDE